MGKALRLLVRTSNMTREHRRREPSILLELPLFVGSGAARRTVDLADGSQVIGQVPDAADRPSQLGVVELTRGAQGVAPAIGLTTKLVAQPAPFVIRDNGLSP